MQVSYGTYKHGTEACTRFGPGPLSDIHAFRVRHSRVIAAGGGGSGCGENRDIFEYGG